MKRGECVHYTGCINPRKPACNAGVNYREHVGGDGFGWVTRLPCFKLENVDPSKIVKCDHFREAVCRGLNNSEPVIEMSKAATSVADFRGDRTMGWER